MSDESPPTVKPLSLYRPVWADGGFCLATNDFSYKDITLVANVPTLVALNNPKRWGLGFTASGMISGSISLGPWPDPTLAGIALTSGSPYLWFNLFTHGPMIQREWYAQVSFGLTIRVFQIFEQVSVQSQE